MKGEEKRWKKSEFVLRVMGIISIDPGSLSSTAHPVLAHHPLLFQSLVGIAGFVRSFVRVGQGKNAWEFIRLWWKTADREMRASPANGYRGAHA